MIHPLPPAHCSATAMPSPGARRGGAALPRAITERSVLIIEDEAMIAWTLESLLEDFGFHRIRIARDADQAVRLAGDEMPGLIVSDINLGAHGPDGIAAVAAIAAVPALFVTGYAGDGERARIAAAGLSTPILMKPVVGDNLRDAIAALLGFTH